MVQSMEARRRTGNIRRARPKRRYHDRRTTEEERRMAIGVDGNEKPEYVEGQPVSFDVGSARGVGRIRGLSMRHIIDFWIVQVDAWESDPPKDYPYSCFVIPHPQLKAL